MTWTWTCYALAKYIEVRESQGLPVDKIPFKDFYDWLVANNLQFMLSSSEGRDCCLEGSA